MQLMGHAKIPNNLIDLGTFAQFPFRFNLPIISSSFEKFARYDLI